MSVDPRILRGAKEGRLPTDGPVQWRAFELATSMNSGPGQGSVQLYDWAWAWPRYWDGTQWVTQAEDDLRFKVFDRLRSDVGVSCPRLTGRGRDTFLPPDDSGSTGLAYRWRDRQDEAEWEIYTITPVAEIIAGESVFVGQQTYLTNVQVLTPKGAILVFWPQSDPALHIPVGTELLGPPWGSWANGSPTLAVRHMTYPWTPSGQMWQAILACPVSK